MQYKYQQYVKDQYHIYIYLYNPIYIYTYTYVYIYIYKHMFNMYICIFKHTYIYIYRYKCIYIHIHIHTYIYIYIHIYIYTHIYIYIYIYIYTYIHIYTYTYININIPSDLLPSHDFDEIAMSSQYRGHFWKKNSLLFFSKKISVINPYRVLCPKTSRIRTPLFIAQSVASWLLMYIHKSLLGLPPTVLVMEFGIPSFSKVQ